jgi:hypothetical protein
MDDFLYAEPLPPIALDSAALQVDETAGQAAITITRGATNAASSVTLTTADGTAKAGSDYSPVNTVVSFAPDETSKTVGIPILNDSVQEKSETFTATLSGAVGGALTGARTATVTIDQPPPAQTVTPPTTPTPTPTPTPTIDVTPPAGGLVSVPSSMKLGSFLKGVTFQVLRNDRSSMLAALEGTTKKATLAANFNLLLASKTAGMARGRTTVKLKPSRSLVGRPKKLTARVRVILTDAAGNRTALVRTIKVKR